MLNSSQYSVFKEEDMQISHNANGVNISYGKPSHVRHISILIYLRTCFAEKSTKTPREPPQRCKKEAKSERQNQWPKTTTRPPPLSRQRERSNTNRKQPFILDILSPKRISVSHPSSLKLAVNPSAPSRSFEMELYIKPQEMAENEWVTGVVELWTPTYNWWRGPSCTISIPAIFAPTSRFIRSSRSNFRTSWPSCTSKSWKRSRVSTPSIFVTSQANRSISMCVTVQVQMLCFI